MGKSTLGETVHEMRASSAVPFGKVALSFFSFQEAISVLRPACQHGPSWSGQILKKWVDPCTECSGAVHSSLEHVVFSALHFMCKVHKVGTISMPGKAQVLQRGGMAEDLLSKIRAGAEMPDSHKEGKKKKCRRGGLCLPCRPLRDFRVRRYRCACESV